LKDSIEDFIDQYKYIAIGIAVGIAVIEVSALISLQLETGCTSYPTHTDGSWTRSMAFSCLPDCTLETKWLKIIRPNLVGSYYLATSPFIMKVKHHKSRSQDHKGRRG